MADNPQEYTLGKHVTIDGDRWLVVRFCDSSTLFEIPKTGDVYIEHEKYVEMRNAANQAKFHTLSIDRTASSRAPGNCRGIKPYFWKGDINAAAENPQDDGGPSPS